MFFAKVMSNVRYPKQLFNVIRTWRATRGVQLTKVVNVVIRIQLTTCQDGKAGISSTIRYIALDCFPYIYWHFLFSLN